MSAFDLHIRHKIPKKKKNHIFTKGLCECLDQHGLYRLCIGVLELLVHIKMTKIPLINREFAKVQICSWFHHNVIFHVFIYLFFLLISKPMFLKSFYHL